MENFLQETLSSTLVQFEKASFEVSDSKKILFLIQKSIPNPRISKVDNKTLFKILHIKIMN